jgi:3-isopropylmalate dehydratase small subunit
MKTAVIAVVMLGLFILCGCDNSQLTQCQQENAALKVEVQKAQADTNAAQTKMDELKKKDQETQTKALDAIRIMMEKQEAKNKEKDARFKEMEAELEKLKAAAESK